MFLLRCFGVQCFEERCHDNGNEIGVWCNEYCMTSNWIAQKRHRFFGDLWLLFVWIYFFSTENTVCYTISRQIHYSFLQVSRDDRSGLWKLKRNVISRGFAREFPLWCQVTNTNPISFSLSNGANFIVIRHLSTMAAKAFEWTIGSRDPFLNKRRRVF